MSEQRSERNTLAAGIDRTPATRHGRAGLSHRAKLGAAIVAPFCLVVAACGHATEPSAGAAPSPANLPATSSTSAETSPPTTVTKPIVPLLKTTNLCALVPIATLGHSLAPQMTDYSGAVCTPNGDASPTGTIRFAGAHVDFGNYPTGSTVSQLDTIIVSDNEHGNSYFSDWSEQQGSQNSSFTIGSTTVKCTYEYDATELCLLGPPVGGEDIAIIPKSWAQQLPDATIEQLFQDTIQNTLLPGYFSDSFGQ